MYHTNQIYVLIIAHRFDLLSRRIRFRRGVNKIIANTENKKKLLVFLETAAEIESSYDKENAKWLLDKYKKLGGKHNGNED